MSVLLHCSVYTANAKNCKKYCKNKWRRFNLRSSTEEVGKRELFVIHVADINCFRPRKGQIPLERPDQTGPDEYFRVSDQVSDHVSDMSSSTSETLSLTKSETFVT